MWACLHMSASWVWVLVGECLVGAQFFALAPATAPPMQYDMGMPSHLGFSHLGR